MPAYQSYPPFLFGLPASHDLALVGTPVVGTLEVNFTWDSDGKSSHVIFGDGQHVDTSAQAANHTYAAHGIYTVSITSGSASDSATLDLSAAADDPQDEPQGEPEPSEAYEEPCEPSEPQASPQAPETSD